MTGYRFRVDGHLDQHWARWFGELSLTLDDDGTTSLSGDIADQAELHGILAKIRDLGVTLISVGAVDPSVPGPHPHVDDDQHRDGPPVRYRQAR